MMFQWKGRSTLANIAGKGKKPLNARLVQMKTMVTIYKDLKKRDGAVKGNGK